MSCQPMQWTINGTSPRAQIGCCQGATAPREGLSPSLDRAPYTSEPADKPDSVSRRMAAIYLCSLPKTQRGRAAPYSLAGTRLCLALLSVGFAWPERSPAPPVVSYTAVSPLPRLRRAVFSLWHSAVGSPRLAVSQHRAL